MPADSPPSSFQAWSFDVGSLMVLISEAEEVRYRLAGRSFAECLVAVPVTGIQCYLKSYEVLLQHSGTVYSSPYGCKTAPLRNMKLDNAIRCKCLLQDGKYTTYRVSPTDATHMKRWNNSPFGLLVLWIIFTWASFLIMLSVSSLRGHTSWIGISACVVFSGWSMALRLVEYFLIHIPPVNKTMVSQPNNLDAAVFLGRGNSALIVEGARDAIKGWTSSGAVYRESAMGVPAVVWQATTRVGTLLVLAFIFVAIPNGTPVDQLIFVLLNLMGQVNVLLGHWFNAMFCLQLLERVADASTSVESRTHVYAKLLRRFGNAKGNNWVEKVSLLPDTLVWRKWQARVVEELDADPKDLYKSIDKEEAYRYSRSHSY